MTDQETDRARKAVEYLAETAVKVAEAKAELVIAEHMVKTAKALAMRGSGEGAISAQEREALASPQYAEAVERVRVAVFEHEKLKAGREAANARIEFWRSLNANMRGAERGFQSAD